MPDPGSLFSGVHFPVYLYYVRAFITVPCPVPIFITISAKERNIFSDFRQFHHHLLHSYRTQFAACKLSRSYIERGYVKSSPFCYFGVTSVLNSFKLQRSSIPHVFTFVVINFATWLRFILPYHSAIKTFRESGGSFQFFRSHVEAVWEANGEEIKRGNIRFKLGWKVAMHSHR